MERFEKVHIGDGAYIHHDGYQFWLTTSNGLETTNEVAFEFSALPKILKFIEAVAQVEIKIKAKGDKS